MCAAAVESRKGAVPAAVRAADPFPFPAHQTGRAQLEHPAFRQTLPMAHGRRPKWTSRSRNTPNFPNTTRMVKILERIEPKGRDSSAPSPNLLSQLFPFPVRLAVQPLDFSFFEPSNF